VEFRKYKGDKEYDSYERPLEIGEIIKINQA
jgi:hypothetical protein